MALKLVDDVGLTKHDDFEDILIRTFKFEGGQTTDHAGPTNLGITQPTADDYYKRKGLPTKSVNDIEHPEAKQIYKEDFWERPKFNKLPKKPGSLLFDFGINAGPFTAARALQKVVGTLDDGDIGPQTIKAMKSYVEKNGEKKLLQGILNKRVEHNAELIRKKPWKYKEFEEGWKNRINELKKEFDLSMLNPFAVEEAEAGETPAKKLTLVDNAGILSSPSTPAKPRAKLSLVDNAGIMPPKTMFKNAPEKNFIGKVSDSIKSVFGKSEEESVAEAQNIYALSKKHNIPMEDAAKDFDKLKHTLLNKPPVLTGQSAFARGAGQGISFGAAPNTITEDELKKEYPVLYTLGALTGGVGSFLLTGGTLQAIGLGTKAVKAGQAALAVSKLGPRIIPRMIMTGATFGTHTAIEETVQAAKDGKVDVIKSGQRIVKDTALGATLGAVGGQQGYVKRAVAATGLGYLSSKTDGSTEADSVLTGVIWGLTELIGGRGRDKVLLKEAVNNIEKSLADWAMAKNPGMNRNDAQVAAREYVMAQAAKSGGIEKVLENPANNLSFLESLNKEVYRQSQATKIKPEAKVDVKKLVGPEEEIKTEKPADLKKKVVEGEGGKPLVVGEAKPKVVSRAEKPAEIAIPEFKGTRQAVEFGIANKDNPDVLKAVETQKANELAEIEAINKTPADQQTDEQLSRGYTLGQRQGLFTEVLRGARGEVTPDDITRVKKAVGIKEPSTSIPKHPKVYPSAQTDVVKATEEEIGKDSVDDIDFMHSGPTLPQSVKKIVRDDVKGNVKMSDAEVEGRFQSSKGVQSTDILKGKIRDFFQELGKRATRTYPTLPNKPEYAELRNTLSKQNIARSFSQDRSIRAIDAITAGFGPQKLDLFTRKVVLDDLAREAEAGRMLPFGYSEITEAGLVIKKEMLAKDKANIDALVEANADVKEAINKRNKLWKAITDELVKYGILTEEQVKQDYFRHQVLNYAQMKGTFGTGKKLKTPRPGYAKGRKGSTFDINTDYAQAEFEVMSQALHDIETAKNIKKIENSPLNIVKQLRDEAKQKNVDWHDLIPEGYTTWQPRDGNIFYSAASLPQRMVDQVLNNAGVEIGIREEDIRKILAIGAKRKEFVLPIEVADTLDNLYTVKNPNWIEAGAKSLTRKWKIWVLSNPRRAFKYNYQNFIGDFDAVIAGDPRILKKFDQANRELIDVFFKGKPLTPDMREFTERGGMSAQMTVNELPELNRIEIFQRLQGAAGSDLKSQLNLWRRYWQGVGTFTTYRESIFRYAAYLHYKDLIASGKKLNYGASNKEEIDALKDPLDKAAKLATELLGDYANITAFGKDMRETVAPFYSWAEINVKRYGRLFRNAFLDGWQEGIRTSGVIGTSAAMKGSFFLAKWMLRAVALTSTMALYNHLFHPDEEEEISEYDKNRIHLILGRTKHGEIILLRGQTAFADILEWFGLDGAPGYWKEYFDNKSSMVDLFGSIPFTDFPAFGLNPLQGKMGLHPFAMKVVRMVNPLYKLPFETMTGKSLPVFDDRGWKVDDKMRNVLRALSLEHEYDLATQKPSRGYARSLAEAFVSIQDPEENAYRYIQGEKYKFLETVKGRGGSGDYYSPRSLVYREYKKALRFQDKSAMERAEKKMKDLGISREDLGKSLKMSDPLSGLSRADKAEFINHYLTKRDKEIYLKRANEYYRKTFLKR